MMDVEMLIIGGIILILGAVGGAIAAILDNKKDRW